VTTGSVTTIRSIPSAWDFPTTTASSTHARPSIVARDSRVAKRAPRRGPVPQDAAIRNWLYVAAGSGSADRPVSPESRASRSAAVDNPLGVQSEPWCIVIARSLARSCSPAGVWCGKRAVMLNPRPSVPAADPCHQ
jgi:hypothetical protein